jgi:TRAP-type C4-dicarboxylate transport system substrate-binding protein
MNFYEVQDYFTQIYAEPFLGIPVINMQHFDGLPAEVQEEMRTYWADAIIPAAEWIDARHEAELEEMLAERPEITYHEVKGAELEEFKEAGRTVYEDFAEIGGPQGQEILDVLLADIENAKAELGIE